jgi:dolichol-phosphate mannosyltransferase
MTAGRTLVVIPAFNEEETIEAVARGARRHADVCVVDDASTDRTPGILAAIDGIHVIRHARNTHIAGAVLDGMRHALAEGYDYVVTMDAGLTHLPEELPRLLEAEPADLVIGTRRWSSVENKPLYRIALSMAGTLLMNAILLDRRRDGPRLLHDCTSGYRRYSRRAIEILTQTPLRSRAFDFLLESLAVLARSGASIREVPITYRFSNSSLNRRIVVEALRSWWALRGGRPGSPGGPDARGGGAR